jgi:hypothetical protein
MMRSRTRPRYDYEGRPGEETGDKVYEHVYESGYHTFRNKTRI